MILDHFICHLKSATIFNYLSKWFVICNGFQSLKLRPFGLWEIVWQERGVLSPQSHHFFKVRFGDKVEGANQNITFVVLFSGSHQITQIQTSDSAKKL